MAGWSVPGVVNPREVGVDPVGRRVIARHHITRRTLAITYLSDELLTDSEFRSRFAREAAQLAQIRDARLARLHRYLECDHDAAVIGDHISGTRLRALLLAQGAAGTEAALVVLTDLLRVLATCHEAGLAHGDIKPESIVLTPAGRVRLIDFGLWTAESRRLLARSTPFYLAPEQWSGAVATAAADVYAATVTFFECLAGAPPFYADGVSELSVRHQQDVPSIDAVPEPVRELVLRGLTKNPCHRPDTRNLLALAVEVATQTAGSGWRRRGRRELAALLAGDSALPDVAVPNTRRGGARKDRRRPVRLAAVVGGALALAAGLSSPPLAVILPGSTLFGSGERSPVLAFPEPDRGSTPVRAATNGPLADRARTPTAQAGTAGPVARARPPAPSIPVPSSPASRTDAPGERHVSQGGSAHPDSTQDPSAPALSACAQWIGGHGPCSALHPEQPKPGPDGVSPDPSSVPVQLPVPIKIPVVLPGLGGLLHPVQQPAPAQPPAAVEQPASAQPLPVQVPSPRRASAPAHRSSQVPPKTSHPHRDQQGSGHMERARQQDHTASADHHQGHHSQEGGKSGGGSGHRGHH
ncbi:MAG: protein kinase domain-containing protein [Pseudonocardiaceae bacterium]